MHISIENREVVVYLPCPTHWRISNFHAHVWRGSPYKANKTQQFYVPPYLAMYYVPRDECAVCRARGVVHPVEELHDAPRGPIESVFLKLFYEP
jgi:hypothetical protein